MRFPLPSSLRSLSFTALGLLASGLACAATPVGAVAGITPGPVADLVVVGRGLDAGFRTGMVCRVARANAEIGELLLVEVRPTCASALITNLAVGQLVRVGDAVTSKISKS